MVDKALFLNMSSAKELMQSMERVSNNLANANTPGFREDLRSVKTHASTPNPDEWLFEDEIAANQKVRGPVNFKQGPIVSTGRALDIAISGDGFIAVQNSQGQEAYTRAGNLHITQDGFLTTVKGDFVLGSNGLLSVANADRVSINKQGLVSAKLRGESDTELADLGRIKIVNPDRSRLRKGQDGLFYLPGGESATEATNVEIIAESIEGSNVQPVQALIDLIDLSRQFEYQTKIMHSLENNEKTANRLYDVTS